MQIFPNFFPTVNSQFRADLKNVPMRSQNEKFLRDPIRLPLNFLLRSYCKNYDFFPLPLPSRYRFLVIVTHRDPSFHHRDTPVPNRPSPTFTVPHRPSPSFTVLHRPSPSLTVLHRPSPFLDVQHRLKPLFDSISSFSMVKKFSKSNFSYFLI
jgi:hypothetical protein